MKNIFALSVLAALLIHTAGAADGEFRVGDDIVVVTSDIRSINGYQVDLMPLHRWLRKPEGERPLKAWKQLQVYTWKGQVHFLDRCVVKVEGGDFTEFYIANLPVEVRQYFIRLKELEAAIAGLSAEIEAQKAAILAANAVLPAAPSVPFYVDPAASARAEANLALASLELKNETLAKWQGEYANLRQVGEKQTKIIALFAGKKWGGLELVDCGRGKRIPAP
jgi:hypothetical protein